jgi:hypothetical protein
MVEGMYRVVRDKVEGMYRVVRKLYRVMRLLMEIEVEEDGGVLGVRVRGVEIKVAPREVEVKFNGLMLLEPKYLSMCLRAGVKTEEQGREVEEKLRSLRWLMSNEERESKEEDRGDREEEGVWGEGGCRVPARLL